MRQAALALAALATAGLLVAAAGATGARFDPYKSLLASAYPDTALPAAFSSAKVAAAAPPNGAVGAVEVNVDGPDPKDGVLFVVFKTPAGAAAGLAAAVPTSPGLALKISGKVPGHPSSALYRGTATTTDALNNATTEGVTYAVVADGNVLVAGFTYSIYAHSGNPGGARKLANSGIAHLGKLSG
jgi:hypothetical protein